MGMATTTSTSSAPGATAAQDKAATRKRVAQLHERCTTFAQNARSFVRKTPRTLTSLGDCRQLVRSSGFVGSNYISADSAASKHEFVSRIGDSRREARQCSHRLQLLDSNLEEASEKMRSSLLKEAGALENIFGAIIGKTLSKTA